MHFLPMSKLLSFLHLWLSGIRHGKKEKEKKNYKIKYRDCWNMPTICIFLCNMHGNDNRPDNYQHSLLYWSIENKSRGGKVLPCFEG